MRGLFLKLVSFFLIAPLIHSAGCIPWKKSDSQSSLEAKKDNPLGANAGCLVCHMTFVFDDLSKVHLENKITCAHCHGISAAHANDEEIGSTPPDKSFKREEVDSFCKRCHTTHNAPAAEVIKVWEKRKRRKGLPVCTDCHGRHRISEAAASPL